MSANRHSRRAVEAALRCHASAAALAIPLLVRLLPLRTLLKAMTPPPRWRPYAALPPERIVAAVNRRLARPRMMRRRACLRRGLMLFHFLRLAGVPARLNIGAYPPPPRGRRMHAHCWVTVDGQPVADPPEAPVAVVLVHGDTPAAAKPNQARRPA